MTNDDQELRRLWAEYLHQLTACRAADEKSRSARVAYLAELPPCPDDVLPGHHHEAYRWLYDKHGCGSLYDAWNQAEEALRATVNMILKTEAEGLFGIGVKLSALPSYIHQEDYEDAIIAVRRDIDRLIGTSFAQHEPQREQAAEEEGAS